MVKTRLEVGGFSAWVLVENQEVDHYGIEVNEETKVSTCWIASTAGKHFELCVEKPYENIDCGVEIFMDGTRIRGSSFAGLQGLWSDVRIGEKAVRPFVFGVLQLTDDESFLSTLPHQELGDIRITVHRISGHKVLTEWSPTWTPPNVSEDDKIHECAKKSVTHRVSFGQTRKLEKERTLVSFTREEEVATFIFRYRSLDILRANEIAPPDPSSAAATSNESVSSKRKAEMKEEEEESEESCEGIDSEDEDKGKEAELEAELQRLRKARLDRRQAGKTKHAKKKVKCEPKRVFLPGEVIDLT